MRAVRLTDWKTFPELQEIERPKPGPGEVLLKVAGAGACHSDVSLFAEFDASMGLPGLQPPYTLGHENSGWVEEVGEGVTGFTKGDAYLVYGPTGCGRCAACARGEETYCENAATNPAQGVGLGRDGGMADYVVVPAGHLIPLGDADPVAAAPLADAALTPYHAIKKALPVLNRGGATALVVGLGGLGQIAVQILRALTGATVIATDMKQSAMDAAAARGAVTVPGGDDQAARIREATGGRGVDAVFDFVGAAPTLKLAMSVVAVGGRVQVVGIAGGVVEWSFFTAPYESVLTSSYWGSVSELHEVVAMYRAGQIEPDIQRFPMDQALDAYRLLHEGKLSARAVVVPHAA
ncbi:NAD(P)-dependent alcohol dehydrogenase [Leucobacter massiliensis]|uniref:Alcohol dehydrogenase n=1 Tax=Leucobacter massiliensis TaxID=1686285 RepID=A0A2S9QKC5_9MICO|nr:NAD(P)-dependent alcohol dehydrogenase [Leucobacter massiliensis]PRI10037.1 alcohol dehydrogenase [Leucobacter massiliensis]PRI10050.1 alcohol dehydrogenase [Leucobacter massiliensis]